MSSSLVPQKPPAGSGSTVQAFEFTKRKRWADLLISELADTCIFILSSTLKIFYCNPAVNDLLGWKEGDIIDHEFTDLVNADDQSIFHTSFDSSLRGNKELLAYVRLKCGTPATSYPFMPMKEVLFEIKGYPRFLVENNPSSGCQCFFAMAKPYISRNITMLNTLMELQLENEHLQTKLKALKANQHSTPSSLYSTSSALFIQQRQQPDNSSPYYSSSNPVKSTIKSSFDNTALLNNPGDEEPEDGQKKKKLKKMHPIEQYVCVTCGRTDSPEWRKGPLGPKTLCNACGLRWAKQMRRTDDPPEASSSQVEVI
ncbi:white collar photoreceptors-like protein [Lentinula aciculospora]|uniref:White collar photoreceptors-like protein n=1 Tax=Lentinula aciculospora TaxID=153920 RepID=A0A9W9APP7_9AGAR|nr:white collar photoreceptors-like protein [Lentinula aciculospora]KAJ4487633.1 white collar photoreceptors-like protein [Lentinula aciculospora]